MSKSDDMLDNKFSIFEKLGEGATANVFLVSKLGQDEKYAAKVLKTQDEFFENEVKMLRMVSNPFITNLVAHGKGPLFKNGENKGDKKYLVMESASKGDLFGYVFYPQRGLGEKYGKLVFQKILKGVLACHKAGVCHRDLKMENILLDENFNPKICDFGFAADLKGDKGDGLLKTPLGTRNYTCAEILAFKAYRGIPADVFSLGVVLLTLVTCKIGFCEATKQDPYYRCIMVRKFDKYWDEVSPSIPEFDSLSEEFKDLYLRMVSYDPKKRPNIEDILSNDPWLKEIRDLTPNQYQNLEKEVYNYFKSLEQEVQEGKIQEIEASGGEDGDDGGFRAVGDENKEYFSLDLKPQYGNTGVGMREFIKLKGEMDPVDFMNKLANGIHSENKDNCEIEESKKNLKFLVTFENDDSKLEEEIPSDLAEELAKLELEGEQEGEKIEENVMKKTSSIQLKLFESYKGGYILRFTKKGGDLKDYYDNLEKIKSIIKEITG